MSKFKVGDRVKILGPGYALNAALKKAVGMVGTIGEISDIGPSYWVQGWWYTDGQLELVPAKEPQETKCPKCGVIITNDNPFDSVCTETDGTPIYWYKKCCDESRKAHEHTIPTEPEIEPQNEVEHAIFDECVKVARMLIVKNRSYGNSALGPLRVFSKADRTEQLRVRIDDKLSRLMRGQAAGEDVPLDLLGYLILLRVAEKTEKNQ